MANTILTPDMITKEAIRVLHEELKFIGTVNRDYDKDFAVEGGKIGDTLRVRKPAQYKTREGDVAEPQDHVEDQTPLVMSRLLGVDANFKSTEMTLDLDNFSDRVLRPQMKALASKVEQLSFEMMNQIGHYVASSETTFLDMALAGARMDLLTTMEGNRCTSLDPIVQAKMVDALKGLYQSSENISQQYRKGYMGTTLGFDFYSSNRMPGLINGLTVTGLTVGAVPQEGTEVLTVAGFTPNETINQGQIFYDPTVFNIHPETKKVYGDWPYEFVVLDSVDADGSGVAQIRIYKVFGSSLDARQNISALPTNGAALTMVGASLGVYRQNLHYQKNAFTFVSADLDLPGGLDMASRQNYENLSLRLLRGFDVTNNKYVQRWDILCGWAVLRDQYACRTIEIPAP